MLRARFRTFRHEGETAARPSRPGFLDRYLAGRRHHAEKLLDEIEELAAGKKRVIWEDGEDITEELLANKRWELHCLLQLIEIEEERSPSLSLH
ncbi:MAG TPA: hypothetical protein VFE10_15750 [Phenylobacterium sp.]|nr:hypothetical protein [Phenylobacterium sp.]